MNRTNRTTAASLISALVLCSCQGVMWGNLAVLALTVGIFLGTISLGKPKD